VKTALVCGAGGFHWWPSDAAFESPRPLEGGCHERMDQTMRVLTVIDDLEIGGTQRVAQNLSLGLAAQGVDTAVLAYLSGGPREAACRDGGLPVFVGPLGTTDALLWRPDIIHIHRTGYTNAVQNRILRHLRQDGAKTVETNVFARFDWSEGNRLIDMHCLLSKWCVFKWTAWGGHAATEKQFCILPNAVDTNAVRPVSATRRHEQRVRFGIPDGRFMFGRVGQPMAPKWMPEVFDVFQKVLQSHDIGLLLVGAPNEIVAKLVTLPTPVRERIINVGVTHSDEELSSLIGAMDGFLHMSAIGESFGMVLCEAMLSGVPVVTLSTTLKDNSQLEVVGHEKGGLVALTLDAVPAAMIRLIGDHKLRDHVRQQGHAWVADRFGVDVICRQAVDIYQTVLSDRQCTATVPDKNWLHTMLTTGVGDRPSLRTSIMFNLVHHPIIYRAYVAARVWK
jgi:glycosyltransferase involved in cell wall biosynthesis